MHSKRRYEICTCSVILGELESDAPKKADFVPKKVANFCIKNSVYLLIQNFFHKYVSGESSAKFSKEAVKPWQKDNFIIC